MWQLEKCVGLLHSAVHSWTKHLHRLNVHGFFFFFNILPEKNPPRRLHFPLSNLSSFLGEEWSACVSCQLNSRGIEEAQKRGGIFLVCFCLSSRDAEMPKMHDSSEFLCLPFSLWQANLLTANQIIWSQQPVKLLSHHWASIYWLNSCLLVCCLLLAWREDLAFAALNKRLLILAANRKRIKWWKSLMETYS